MGVPSHRLPFEWSSENDFRWIGWEIDDGEIAAVLAGGAEGVADNGYLLCFAGGDDEDFHGPGFRDPKATSTDDSGMTADGVKVRIWV